MTAGKKEEIERNIERKETTKKQRVRNKRGREEANKARKDKEGKEDRVIE